MSTSSSSTLRAAAAPLLQPAPGRAELSSLPHWQLYSSEPCLRLTFDQPQLNRDLDPPSSCARPGGPELNSVQETAFRVLVQSVLKLRRRFLVLNFGVSESRYHGASRPAPPALRPRPTLTSPLRLCTVPTVPPPSPSPQASLLQALSGSLLPSLSPSFHLSRPFSSKSTRPYSSLPLSPALSLSPLPHQPASSLHQRSLSPLRLHQKPRGQTVTRSERQGALAERKTLADSEKSSSLTRRDQLETTKSNTRKHRLSTIRPRIAVSCVGFRGVGGACTVWRNWQRLRRQRGGREGWEAEGGRERGAARTAPRNKLIF